MQLIFYAAFAAALVVVFFVARRRISKKSVFKEAVSMMREIMAEPEDGEAGEDDNAE